MLTFEVHVNGKKVCTAGIDEPGVLSSILTWCSRDSSGSLKAREDIDLRVGGLVSRTEEHVDWLSVQLRRGDELRIRIVEADAADIPHRKRRENQKEKRQLQEAYFRRMARRLGWEIKKKQ